jgi:hypothetical protein
MSFSLSCRTAIATGLRLLPEMKLLETGRTWNLPPCEEMRGPLNSELWQNLDEYVISPASTHSVYVTYYLEVSEAKGSSASRHSRNNHDLPINKSAFGGRKGGLLVVGKDAIGTKIKEQSTVKVSARGIRSRKERVEALEQKRVISSQISTREGCEVRIYFKYKPTVSYSLMVYGPFNGGRVSISNARVRQVSVQLASTFDISTSCPNFSAYY